MKHLLIIGAGGFGREVYATFIASKSFMSHEIDVKGFLDDKADALDGYSGDWPPILSSVESYEIQADDVFFCALGNGNQRKHCADIIAGKGGEFINIIHHTVQMSRYTTIGVGCYIGSFTTISPDVKIGNHVMIQAHADLGHDAVVGDYASIESYVFLGGHSSVGELSTMHTKSSIIPSKSVGRECSVGVGSVVMKHVKDGVSVFGNPAKKMDF